MARIETDPNYTAPTFPRATAGPDIFKKEDVQKLAEALSVHTNDGAGHGLPINGASIAPGSITSAQIADGAIQGTDIADNTINASTKIFTGSIIGQNISDDAIGQNHLTDNAVTTAALVSGAVSNYNGQLAVLPFSTSQVGTWVATPLSINFTTAGGGVFLWFAFNCSYAAPAGAYFRIGISIDSGGAITMQSSVNNIADQAHRVGAVYLATGLSAAPHNFTVYVLLNAAGTFAFDGGTPASVVLLEMKR
jgi:hypothetical protein